MSALRHWLEAPRETDPHLASRRAAHEINNLLGYVMANLALIEEPISPEDDPRELARATLEAVARIRDITRELQSAGRPSESPPGSADLRRVLDFAVDATARSFVGRGRVVREYGDLPRVTGGETRLCQVFVNLLLNSAQALPAGDADRHDVIVRASGEGASAVIEVVDDGCGIPDPVASRLFEPLVTTRSGSGGNGLGLAICREIVEWAGGTIGFRSRPGAGTVFRVELPVDAG